MSLKGSAFKLSSTKVCSQKCYFTNVNLKKEEKSLKVFSSQKQGSQ